MSILLEDAREMVTDNLDAGISCPCCGQYARRYRRKMRSEIAYFLLWLVKKSRQNPDEWIDVRGIDVRGGDYAKASHWGLAFQRPNSDKSKRTSGLWMPSLLGEQFVDHKVKIPSHVYLYNHEVVGWSDESISIVDALGCKFDYEELMSNQTTAQM